MPQIGVFILSLLTNAQQNLRFYQFLCLKRAEKSAATVEVN
jgi:hypothetical protein